MQEKQQGLLESEGGVMKKRNKKIRNQLQAELLVHQLMKTETFQRAKLRDAEQATYDAFNMCCFIALQYLEEVFHCKHNGLKKLVEWFAYAKEEMDEDYFIRRAKHHKEVHNLDVLQILGFEFERVE